MLRTFYFFTNISIILFKAGRLVKQDVAGRYAQRGFNVFINLQRGKKAPSEGWELQEVFSFFGCELVGRLEDVIGEVEEMIGKVEEVIGKGSKLIGRGSKLIGKGSKLIGKGSKLIGKGSKLIGKGSKLIGKGFFVKKC